MKTCLLKQIVVVCSISSSAALAVADPPMAKDAPTTSMNTSMSPITPQRFVTDAAMGGMKEVVLGNEALERSQNADVKRFASMIVQDHTAANNQLAMIAKEEGLQLPSTNTYSVSDPFWENPVIKSDQTIKGQQAELLTTTNWPYLSEYMSMQHLKTLSGPAFDQAYLSDMVSDHAQDITEFEAASRELTDLQLKQFALATLPKLREHYHMAQQLAAKFATAPANNTKGVMQSAATPGGM